MTKVNVNSQKPRHLQNHILPPAESLPLRALFKENLGTIGRGFAATLLFLPFWLVFGFIIIIGNGVGGFLAMLGSSRIPQPETSDLLSPLDALWILQPGSKAPKQIAHVVMRLSEGMIMKDFLDILTNRLLNVKNPRGSPPYIYMRFRQRVYTIPGTSRHVFAFSPRFDIANHIHQIPEEVDNMDKFMEWASTISTNNLEVEKPLWEMYVRTEFGPDNSSILLFRFHQCITDGQSMIQALCRDVLDNGEQVYAHMKARFGGLTYASHFCQAVLMSGYIFFTDLIGSGTHDLNVLKYPEMRLSGKHEVFWSEPVNLSVIQRLKTITKVKFNDLLLTALAATLRTYCKMHGVSIPADFTACFPVDLRSAKGENLSDLRLGNRCVMEKIKLPVGQEAALTMLWRVRDQTHRLRHSYRHVALDFLIKILGIALPHRSVQKTINRHYTDCSLMVNSLHGPDGRVSIQKFGVEQMLMWGPPPIEMKIPLTVNFITNNEQIYVVVVADTGVIRDGFWIAMDFPHEVMALGNLLKTRHTPESAGGPTKPVHLTPAPGEDGTLIVANPDSEEAVQASLHVLEERLIKIQMKLQNMRAYREDIGKVPALWRNLNLRLPSHVDEDDEDDEDDEEEDDDDDDDEDDGEDNGGEEDEESNAKKSGTPGDGDSDDDDDDEEDSDDDSEDDSDETSEERPSVPNLVDGKGKILASPALTPTSSPATSPVRADRVAAAAPAALGLKPPKLPVEQPGGANARGASGPGAAPDRRVSGKPQLFSRRSSLPDPAAEDTEAPVRIPGRALRGRPPRRLSLNRGPGQTVLGGPPRLSRPPPPAE